MSKITLHRYFKAHFNHNKNLAVCMFKPNPDKDDFKKHRETQTIQIRRNNREEIFSKRRFILYSQDKIENQREPRLLIVDERFKTQIQNFLRTQYDLSNFEDLLSSINDRNIVKQHLGVIGIRKLLSITDFPPIQEVINAGLIPKLIGYVSQTQYPQLQLQATWALTNVATGNTTQCLSIIQKGGLALFIQLLKSSDYCILEQAIWAIGNIGSDCATYRDMIISLDGVTHLVNAIKNLTSETLIKHGCWALSNLCRGNPLPKYQQVKHGIQTLCLVIGSGKIKDKQVLADCFWAISYHSENSKSQIQIVVKSNILPIVIQNLQSKMIGLACPCIRIIGNISAGSNEHTNYLLSFGILDYLQKLLNHEKKIIRREVCWVISNITAGSKNQTELVLAKPALLNRVLQLFYTDGNDVKRQICYIFSNFAHLGDPLTIFNFYQQNNIVSFYVNLLTAQDNKTVEVSLQCLLVILTFGQKFANNFGNPFAIQLRNTESIGILEKLQYHKSNRVYQLISKLLTNFFETQESSTQMMIV